MTRAIVTIAKGLLELMHAHYKTFNHSESALFVALGDFVKANE